MKCCSRSTLGVVIGILNILIYLGASTVVIGIIKKESFNLNSKSLRDKEDAAALSTILLSTILSACFLMVILSGLLIMGIVKRRHMLMYPWLALSGLGFVCNCIRVLVSTAVALVNGIPIETSLMLLMIGVLGVGLQALILWPICTLCRDIKQKKHQQKPILTNDINYSYMTSEDPPPQYNYQIDTLPQKSKE